jgi:hypothetical protein
LCSLPEEWLFKAWADNVLIDVIFRPSGVEMTDEVLGRAELISVMSVQTSVMALEDVLVTMLCAIDEHTVNYSRLVAIARSLREQVDWPRLWERTAGSPYAKAFATLVEELGIAPRRGAQRGAGANRVRVIATGAPGTTAFDEAARRHQ